MKYVFLLFLLFMGCDKDSNDDILEANAILSWTGDYAVDGCGFFITIGEKEYKPENESIIPESFQSSENMIVFIEYELSVQPVEYICGFEGPSEMDGIFIHKIE